MPTVFEPDHDADSRAPYKHQLESYDSGPEFSFSNWIRTRDLVEDEDFPLDREAPIFVSEIVAAVR